MKIAITTAWDETYDPIVQITLPRMAEYCTRRGYDLRAYPNRFTLDPSDLFVYGDRCKLQIYKDLYEEKKWDAIVWLDIDCLITNPGKSIDHWAESFPFTWSYDVSGPLSGLTIARTDPAVHMWLNAVQHKCVELKSERAPNGESDQVAMRQLMLYPPYDFARAGLVACKDIGHCFDYSLYGWERYNRLGNWEPGDWIFTVPGLPLEQRIAKLKEKLELCKGW